MPALTRADGFPTGALHGWVKTLWFIEDHFKPKRMVVFFDLGGARRQTELHADYKANRSDTPVELEQQLPVIKQLTIALGYGGVESDGVEADDLIASAAVQCAQSGEQVAIISADKDLAQLVRPGICQWLPPPTAQPSLGWRCLDAQSVEDKFGVPPHKIADYLAIIGDTSDNIPGLHGVGPKTAAKWLQRYGNLEAIIAHCGELQPKRFQAVVHSQQELLRRNLLMTTLDTSLQVDLPGFAPDLAQVCSILQTMEMSKTLDQAKARLER
ncbi:MAG: hypothetical protein LR015_13315 [Verrucomicrobia bacterium]|nr:hypothetical protein [Verrucomicrobiota bacterium]